MPPLQVERLGRIAYESALALQEQHLAAKLGGEATDYLLLLEHEPVYTLGRGAEAGDLRGAPERLGVPVFRVGRGGGVTFHGPGQLVGYPIVALSKHGRDVHRYVRRLEAVLTGVCAEFGLLAHTPSGQTGVWIDDRKIASIGIGVRRWVSWHGIALNVAVDLAYFRAIVPCAMPALRMTSLREELGSAPEMELVEALVESHFRRVFGYGQTNECRIEGRV